MKPYSPFSNKGRTVSIEDIHHRSADQSRLGDRAAAKAKAMRHAARQGGRRLAAALVNRLELETRTFIFN